MYKIIQIIPAQPGTKVCFDELDELGNFVPFRDKNGNIEYDKNGNPKGASRLEDALCLALVEEHDGSRMIKPVVCMGEYADVAEGYFATIIDPPGPTITIAHDCEVEGEGCNGCCEH